MDTIIVMVITIFVFLLSQFMIPGIFILVIVLAIKKNKETISLRNELNNSTINSKTTNKIVCPKCGYEMAEGNIRCSKCGESLKEVKPIAPKKYVCDVCKSESTEEIKICRSCGSDKISVVEEEKTNLPSAEEGTPIDKNNYANYLYSNSEYILMKDYIGEELKKTTIEKSQSLTGLEIRRTIMTIIYCVILLLVSLLYVSYHTNLFLIIIVLIVITVIFSTLMSRSGLTNYLAKEVKSRPDEKVSYVIASTLSNQKCNKYIGLSFRILLLVATIVIPFIVFKEPHLVYEKVENGYNLRYYTLGLLKHDKVLEIPSQYNGENVVGIRGNVFENVYSIERVILPETIEEIRGEAFMGCTRLREINLPHQITEIHGGTFQNCSSLQKIVIPYGVTRIGGSAFRYCSSLTDVTIPSTVTEIGSSAFRETGLSNVCISENAYVNERAFKGTDVAINYYENGCISTGDYYNE